MKSKDFKCNICNKFYVSYKTLWDHNKKFHKNKTVTEVDVKVVDVDVKVVDLDVKVVDLDIKIVDNKKYKCEYCNKIFASRYTKYVHKKKVCKLKNNNIELIDNNNNIKLELLEKENKEIKNSLIELKDLILKNAKIHPKTLQKINNQLINNNTNNTNNTTNNINNTIINNTYVKFGSVAHSTVLSEAKILSILNRPYKSIEESIKLIHFNKNLPEYNNIMITNMKDNIAYTYNGNKFICVNKDELIDELIENHKDQIEVSYDEYKDKIREFTRKHVEAFFVDINNETEIYKDQYNKSYKHFKSYKMQDIKMLIYNLSDSKKLELLKNMDLKEKII